MDVDNEYDWKSVTRCRVYKHKRRERERDRWAKNPKRGV